MDMVGQPDETSPGNPASRSTAAGPPGADNSTSRRNWIVEWSAVAFGALVGLIPLLVGAITFLDPWRRRTGLPKSRQAAGGGPGQEGFVRVAALDGLTVGGPPQRFPVIADHVDAWNFIPNQPVGAVFLQRVADHDVRCFNATCPHAGCSVSLQDDAYLCPCHNSAFNLDGTKRTSGSGRENPSPRSLDSLPVDAEKLQANEVWVEFMNFYTGKHEKIPKT
jgi:menaquinol-cytochrome c reductase iron-sulfur subunit